MLASFPWSNFQIFRFMTSSSSSDEEYTSLADKLKEKYVSDIEATLKTIKRVEEISDQLVENRKSRKRKADRKLASWIDAKIEPERTNSTGPGCSICISTFEELQSEGKQVRKYFPTPITLFQLKTTPCGHVYCADCLEISTAHSKKCPKCRKNINLKKCHAIYPDLLE